MKKVNKIKPRNILTASVRILRAGGGGRGGEVWNSQMSR
jgi:hypothetical protein